MITTQPEKKPDEINAERDKDLEIYRFNRHRFADVNDDFAFGGTAKERSKARLKLGTQRFKEVQAFMQTKEAEFNRMVANDLNAGGLLSAQPTPVIWWKI